MSIDHFFSLLGVKSLLPKGEAALFIAISRNALDTKYQSYAQHSIEIDCFSQSQYQMHILYV
ncbi:unnamed protein product [Paramecium primaurelia]|uniref:Uncharacterized protein n=1 Tax=Paramecium primaurelia TaxID=5886 RepID=A0A8S1Q3S1_PARPR|nr:unnamed protein product [Paramecium primaurelia]